MIIFTWFCTGLRETCDFFLSFFIELEPRVIEPTLIPNFAPWVNIDTVNNRWALTFSEYVHEPDECWDPAINTTIGAMEYFRFFPLEWDDALARAKMLKVPLLDRHKEFDRFGTNVFANMIYSWSYRQQREFFIVMGMSSDEIEEFFQYHIEVIEKNIYRMFFQSKYNELTAPAILERGDFLRELLVNAKSRYSLYTDLQWIREYGELYTAYNFPGVGDYGDLQYFRVRTMWGYSGYYHPRSYENWDVSTWILFFIFKQTSILYYHSKIFTYFPNFKFDKKYSNAPVFVQLLYLKLLAFDPKRIRILPRFFEWVPYSWKW